MLFLFINELTLRVNGVQLVRVHGVSKLLISPSVHGGHPENYGWEVQWLVVLRIILAAWGHWQAHH